MSLTFILHSHPGKDGTKGGSFASGDGDIPTSRRYLQRWINSGKPQLDFPIHGIYHPESSTIYYYTPYMRRAGGIKGHTFRNQTKNGKFE